MHGISLYIGFRRCVWRCWLNVEVSEGGCGYVSDDCYMLVFVDCLGCVARYMFGI